MQFRNHLWDQTVKEQFGTGLTLVENSSDKEGVLDIGATDASIILEEKNLKETTNKIQNRIVSFSSSGSRSKTKGLRAATFN